MPRSGQDHRPHPRLALHAGRAWSASVGPGRMIALALFFGVTSRAAAQSGATTLPDDHPVQIQRRAAAARKSAGFALGRPAMVVERSVAPETPPSAAPVPAPPPKLEGVGLMQAEEVAALKADAVERLQALAAPSVEGGAGVDPKAVSDPMAKQVAKALQDELQERQKRLDEYDKTAKELSDLNSPDENPTRQLAEATDEAAGLQEQLKRPVEDLLPAVFRPKDRVDEADRVQMKEAIEAVKKEVEEFQVKLRDGNPEPLKEAAKVVTNLRAERDKIAQRVAALKARDEGNATTPPPKSSTDRKLAEEKATTLRVELTVETLRLRAMDLKIARTTKAAEAAAARRAAWIARQQLGRKRLEPMQARFRKVAEDDEREFKRQADAEQDKAKLLQDPLERYKAGRAAEHLGLKAVAVKFEQAATAGTTPSLEDQRGLAARASANLARIKPLLDEGRLSQYDAILLNADYRSIGPERDRIRRNELAAIENQVRDYANLLTSAELELIEDGLIDQIERDNLLDALPPERHADAEAELEKLEAEHRVLLTRRRDALRALLNRRHRDARGDQPPARNPRRGIQLHPHPPVLGPRPRADRPVHDRPRSGRVAAAGQGVARAGRRDLDAEVVAAAHPPVPGRGAGRRSRFRRASFVSEAT